MKIIASVLFCICGLLVSYPGFAIPSGTLRGSSCEVASRCWHSSSTTVKYLYNSTVNSCVRVGSSCATNNISVFADLSTCQVVCVPSFDAADCEKSRHGCCADGLTPRGPAGLCVEEEQAASNGSGSFTHWQLAVAGICSVLLAVGIVSLVFAVAYVDRKRRRDKQRRYINQVLKMYEDSVISGDSDSSSDDNPETKNLFERL